MLLILIKVYFGGKQKYNNYSPFNFWQDQSAKKKLETWIILSPNKFRNRKNCLGPKITIELMNVMMFSWALEISVFVNAYHICDICYFTEVLCFIFFLSNSHWVSTSDTYFSGLLNYISYNLDVPIEIWELLSMNLFSCPLMLINILTLCD